jgi:hypothetical protein
MSVAPMDSTTTIELSCLMKWRLRLRAAAAILVFFSVALCGCASTPYSYGSAARYYSSPELAARTEVQMERGRPQKAIDTFGWIWGIPSKILLWDRRVENHRIDAHTESQELLPNVVFRENFSGDDFGMSCRGFGG